MEVELPNYIALCGYPKAGKDEVAKILAEEFGTTQMDSGKPLREMAITYLGLTRDQVYTQEGKISYIDLLGKNVQVRWVLGELGKNFEKMLGPHVMPHMIATLMGPTLGKTFVDSSCRMSQASYWKSRGAIVIGINNPLVTGSPYDFDQFDHTLVDVWIHNDAQARGLEKEAGLADLREKVKTAVMEALLKDAIAA